MRRQVHQVGWWGVCVGLAVIGHQAFAADEHAQVPVTVPAVTSPLPSAEDNVRAQLNGTRWLLELTPLGGGETLKAQKDTVSFDARQVSSERLVKDGYPMSNYTLTIGGDGVPVWETMQTKEGAGVVFWRGEVLGGTMRGVVSRHPLEGTTEDFSFTGREANKKSIDIQAQGTVAAPPHHVLAPPTTASEGAAEPPKKKKRKGLFGR